MASSRRINRITRKQTRAFGKGKDARSLQLQKRKDAIATGEVNRADGNGLVKKTLNKVVDPLRNAVGLPAKSLSANAYQAFPKADIQRDASGKVIPTGAITSPASALAERRDVAVGVKSGQNSQNSSALIPNIGPANVPAPVSIPTKGTSSGTSPEKQVITEPSVSIPKSSGVSLSNPSSVSSSAKVSAPSSLSTGISSISGGNANTSTGGIQLNPDGTPALGSDFEYDLTPEQRAEASARRREEDYYDRESKQSLSRSSIMRDAMRAFQGEIDAVNSVYADKLKQARLAGADRLGSDRAENFNAGAVNSSFGNASRERVLDFNRGAEGAVYNEKLQLISQINSAARAVGDKYYAEKKAAKEAGLESYLTSIKGSNEAKKAIAVDVASNIYRANLSPEKIDKKQLEKIAKNAGVSVRSVEDSFREIVDAAEAQAEADRLAAEKAARDGAFNLSEGQARYDANGNLIASRSKTYAPSSGSSGVTYNPDGTVKLSSPQKTAINQVDTVLSSLDDYSTLYSTLANKGGGKVFGADSSRLSSAYNSLMFQIAQAAGTGALQAADREIVEAMIPNPTRLGSALRQKTKGGKAGGVQGLAEARSLFVNKKQAILTDPYSTDNISNGSTNNSTSPSSQLRDASGNLFDASQLTPQEYQEALADGLVPV